MKRLQVLLLGEPVGILEQTPTGRIEFSYADAWLQKEGAHPLSQSLPLQARVFDERECVGFFGGLLPVGSRVRMRDRRTSARIDVCWLSGMIGR